MKPTYSVIGRSYIIPSLFSCWKKLHDTVMIFYTKLCPDKASASLSSNLVSIVSSTLILQACLASETVTWWLVFTTLYLKHFHLKPETWTCLNSGHSQGMKGQWAIGLWNSATLYFTNQPLLILWWVPKHFISSEKQLLTISHVITDSDAKKLWESSLTWLHLHWNFLFCTNL